MQLKADEITIPLLTHSSKRKFCEAAFLAIAVGRFQIQNRQAHHFLQGLRARLDVVTANLRKKRVFDAGYLREFPS